MKKRTSWKAHEVQSAIQLALDFERSLSNEAWCHRYQTSSNNEAAQWHEAAKRALLGLRDLGLPDIVLQGLIGFNHSLAEFGL